MVKDDIRNQWDRAADLIEDVAQNGEPQSNIHLMDQDGKRHTLPERLIPVLVAALREIRFGHTPTAVDSDLPVDLMQASILTGCVPEALAAAVALDRIPSHRLPDGRLMMRLADVVSFLDLIIPDGEIARNRHLLYRAEAEAWEIVEFGDTNRDLKLISGNSRSVIPIRDSREEVGS